MLLHWSPRSPYVRKIMIAAHEMGLHGRINTVRTVVGGTSPHLELMKHNPLGKIPTLELADGTILYDSPVIIEYLDTLHDGPKLYPQHWPERLVALRRHALGQGMLDIGLLLVGERWRPADHRSQPHMDLWQAKLRACIDALEREADALAASGFDIGHLAIGVALSYLDFRCGDMGWRDGHPRLAAWHATFDARPSVKANLPVDDR
ncbi:MAG: glutathione S-transferase family protein [Acetobacteraceae bacterium]|nr:glutathione S-transferase family protein [Acetobacteraceae bacterium]